MSMTQSAESVAEPSVLGERGVHRGFPRRLSNQDRSQGHAIEPVPLPLGRNTVLGSSRQPHPIPRRKRAFDLAVAVPLAIASLPLVAALAVGSLAAFRATPFFVQDRLGAGGGVFRFTKIRSLPSTTPADIDKNALAVHRNGRWGELLRKYHLDELPQLWLVVAGRMSLVGPRPEMPGLSQTFDDEFVEERLTMLPGCTGLWQVSSSSAGLIGEAPQYDLHYVRKWTLRLDAWVLLYTVREVLGGNSLEGLHQIPRWTGASVR